MDVTACPYKEEFREGVREIGDSGSNTARIEKITDDFLVGMVWCGSTPIHTDLFFGVDWYRFYRPLNFTINILYC